MRLAINSDKFSPTFHLRGSFSFWLSEKYLPIEMCLPYMLKGLSLNDRICCEGFIRPTGCLKADLHENDAKLAATRLLAAELEFLQVDA